MPFASDSTSTNLTAHSSDKADDPLMLDEIMASMTFKHSEITIEKSHVT